MLRSKSAWISKSDDAAPSPSPPAPTRSITEESRQRQRPPAGTGGVGSREESSRGDLCRPPLTVLREFRGAHESGHLEGVFADGAAAEALHAPARGRVALLLQLGLRGGQAQVRAGVFQLLRFGLWVSLRDMPTTSHRHETQDAFPSLVVPDPLNRHDICSLSLAKLLILMVSRIPVD